MMWLIWLLLSVMKVTSWRPEMNFGVHDSLVCNLETFLLVWWDFRADFLLRVKVRGPDHVSMLFSLLPVLSQQQVLSDNRRRRCCWENKRFASQQRHKQIQFHNGRQQPAAFWFKASDAVETQHFTKVSFLLLWFFKPSVDLIGQTIKTWWKSDNCRTFLLSIKLKTSAACFQLNVWRKCFLCR